MRRSCADMEPGPVKGHCAERPLRPRRAFLSVRLQTLASPFIVQGSRDESMTDLPSAGAHFNDRTTLIPALELLRV